MITAYYGIRRGGSGQRTIRNADEAERILTGRYGVTTVRLVDEHGNTIGERWKDTTGRWLWYFDPDPFAFGQ